MNTEQSEVQAAAASLQAALETVIDGHREALHRVITVLFAGGHILLEDAPGVGKTVLAKALARSVGGEVNRVQFTPDLLPSDVTGVTIFDRATSQLRFHPGPVFANVVIADEINRAPAKTQSALLEAMEERQVSTDGTTHPLPDPFMVLATQNPWDLEGTYPLPEAQRDRFMARLSLGYPSAEAEARMLSRHRASDPLDSLQASFNPGAIRALQSRVCGLHVAEEITAYLVALGRATREHPAVRLGVSPRGVLQWMRLAQAEAATQGRDFVAPTDVQTVARVVVPHRLVMAGPDDAASSGALSVLDEVVAGTAVPGTGRRG